jgi:TonB family protein
MPRSSVAGIQILLFLVGMLLGNPSAAQTQGDSLSARIDSIYATLESDLDTLASREEKYYSEHHSYSADFRELSFGSSKGVTVVLYATNGGWRARATSSGLEVGKGCAIYDGAISPPISPVEPSRAKEVFCSPSIEPRPQADPRGLTITADTGFASLRFEPAELKELVDGPVFTPYTVRPDVTNRGEVARALEREYPPSLRDAGIGGRVRVWFLIDARGVVRKLQIDESSGRQALDEAAIRVAGVFRFDSARNREQPVPVWVSIPILFTPSTPQRAEARAVSLTIPASRPS